MSYKLQAPRKKLYIQSLSEVGVDVGVLEGELATETQDSSDSRPPSPDYLTILPESVMTLPTDLGPHMTLMA